jgi:hypothetical protein
LPSTISVSGADGYSLNTNATQFPIVVTVTAPTIYTITGNYVFTGCASSKTVTLGTLCTSLEEESGGLSSEILIYPNPVQDVLTVEAPEDLQIEIYDALGKRVFYSERKAEKHLIYLGNLSKGIYFLSAVEGNSRRTLKFIKE